MNEDLKIKAKQLLESDFFKDVLAEMKNGVFEGWSRTDADDVKIREQQFALYCALCLVEERVRSIAEHDLVNKAGGVVA